MMRQVRMGGDEGKEGVRIVQCSFSSTLSYLPSLFYLSFPLTLPPPLHHSSFLSTPLFPSPHPLTPSFPLLSPHSAHQLHFHFCLGAILVLPHADSRPCVCVCMPICDDKPFISVQSWLMQPLHQLRAASGLHGTCEARVLLRLVKYRMTHGIKHASVCVFICVYAHQFLFS